MAAGGRERVRARRQSAASDAVVVEEGQMKNAHRVRAAQ